MASTKTPCLKRCKHGVFVLAIYNRLPELLGEIRHLREEVAQLKK